jgi:hypothetical protein
MDHLAFVGEGRCAPFAFVAANIAIKKVTTRKLTRLTLLQSNEYLVAGEAVDRRRPKAVVGRQQEQPWPSVAVLLIPGPARKAVRHIYLLQGAKSHQVPKN